MEYKIVKIENQDDILIVKELFKEYAQALGFDLCFQNFQKELENLPGDYAYPDGSLILAKSDNKIIGCVAVRKFEDNICEMKRLYVKPEFRRNGIGRLLVEVIIKEAKKIGYKKMRLDTISEMKEAINLYNLIGFNPIAPYRMNPIEGAICFELNI